MVRSMPMVLTMLLVFLTCGRTLAQAPAGIDAAMPAHGGAAQAAPVVLPPAAAENATVPDIPAPPDVLPSETGVGGAYVQVADEGRIDWQEGLVTARGVGLPPPFAATPAQAGAMAVRAAELTARKNLLEILQGVRIDASSTVENRMLGSDATRAQVSGVLQNSRILQTDERPDGSVEVTVGVSLHGGFGAIMLPRTMPVRQAASAPRTAEGGPTGLLVDARGLGARPAMTPRLLDEDGREIYGVSVADRRHAVEQGMAGYAKNREQALQNPRITGRPHVVKAVRAEGANRTDLVVAATDAEELRRLAAQGDFLEKCRVMILLD